MPQYIQKDHRKRRRRMVASAGAAGIIAIAGAFAATALSERETAVSSAPPGLNATSLGKESLLTPRKLPAPALTVDPTTTPSPSETQTDAPSSPATSHPPHPGTTPTSPSGSPTSSPTNGATDEPATMPGGFPDETTTGVPDGVDLTPSDSIEITEDGSVIDAMEITGKVTVRANNVTIMRSKIVASSRYAIEIDSGYENLVVEDTEIDGNDGNATIAILSGDYTLRRVNIHDVHDGPRIQGDNVVIEDSYIHRLHRAEGGHHDSIQMRKGTNIRVLGNTLAAYNPDTGDPMNAAIQFGSLMDTLDDVVVDGNLMNGGNYTINAGKLEGGEVIFRNNRFMRDYRYGVLSSGPGLVWEDTNVYHDTEEPAP